MGNKKIYSLILIIFAATLVFWWWSSRQASVQVPSDTSDISQELDGLQVNDLDKEFEEINQGLETL